MRKLSTRRSTLVVTLGAQRRIQDRRVHRVVREARRAAARGYGTQLPSLISHQSGTVCIRTGRFSDPELSLLHACTLLRTPPRAARIPYYNGSSLPESCCMERTMTAPRILGAFGNVSAEIAIGTVLHFHIVLIFTVTGTTK